LLESVGVGVPYSYRTILGTGDDDGQFGVIAGKRNVVGVTFEGSDQGLCSVIPNLDSSVVRCGEEIGLVGVRVVIDVVNTLGLMCLEGEVRSRRSKAPDLDSSIKTSRSKGVCILGVDGQTHDIVTMTLKDLHTLPTLLPIPKLDGHVIGGSQDERLCGVNGDSSNVVGVRLEGGDLLGGVVIVDS
jgi:hypothetical protein